MTSKEKIALYKFIKYAVNELNITLKFKLKLSNSRAGFKTYAYYDPNEKVVAVYIGKRAIGDVMRSVAHELVHHKQIQTGEVKAGQKVQDIGGKIEDDANAIAGQLIKKYGYDHPDEDIWNADNTQDQ